MLNAKERGDMKLIQTILIASGYNPEALLINAIMDRIAISSANLEQLAFEAGYFHVGEKNNVDEAYAAYLSAKDDGK